ncbi:uncharacterized protein Osi24 [Chelonus insularis]|uniref:uncharacterized protein Osi24 n=1 Tax=Chelonus insularis TaxID=460826 RepID=UPI0015885686|nr:uncharacterized protein LOC118073466 [Chelonus insularis]XP_034949869.1 uncharacterized protein LOC118073466 [Chelonus insularis]
MGRIDTHCFITYYVIVVIVTIACLRVSCGFKVEDKNTQFNETESNEVHGLDKLNDIRDSSLNNILADIPEDVTVNWNDEQSNLNDDFHPHNMKDKPTKFDSDISEMIYMDTNSSKELEKNISNSSNQIRKNSETSKNSCRSGAVIDCLEKNVGILIDNISKKEALNITESIQIVRSADTLPNNDTESLFEKVRRFAKSHIMEIKLNKDIFTRSPRTFFGTFGLKKLLLPLFIGAQIIKSILIALFLPSILGSIGQIVGKGVSSFAQSSQGATAPPEENFEFKDNADPYNDDYMTRQPLGTLPAPEMYDESMAMQPATKPNSRYSYVDSRLSPAALDDKYYTRMLVNSAMKKQNFKIFHNIPPDVYMFKNYDPFYSPLLSRLDAVFARLGYITEGCREYAVCAMYRSPARYAPYSNLISAQLSKELNELRKPANDNPDILRFFRYMKAATDGQDGVRCETAYTDCNIPRDDPSLKQNQAMLATYQDIDKLVHARKL